MSKPELVQFASSADPTCCQFQEPPPPDKKQGPFVAGISVTATFSYRGSPGAPVTSVVIECANSGRHVWDLRKDEQDQSEKGSVSYEFEVCLPCTAIAPDRTAHFELVAHDKKKNRSNDRFGITIGEDQFVQCCGNMPRKRVRPVPKGG